MMAAGKFCGLPRKLSSDRTYDAMRSILFVDLVAPRRPGDVWPIKGAAAGLQRTRFPLRTIGLI